MCFYVSLFVYKVQLQYSHFYSKMKTPQRQHSKHFIKTFMTAKREQVAVKNKVT